MIGDKIGHHLAERERAHPQQVDRQPLRFEAAERFGHWGAGRAVVDHPAAGRFLGFAQDRLRHQRFGRIELPLQALHVVEVIGSCFRVVRARILRGPAREVTAQRGMCTRIGAIRNAIAVHILIATEVVPGIQHFARHDLAAVEGAAIIPLKWRAQALVHADVEIAHHEHGSL